ncbi:MAG: hypothetical protein ACJAZ2_001640 [Glaciecola sp.]|jgi:hypothetical protein
MTKIISTILVLFLFLQTQGLTQTETKDHANPQAKGLVVQFEKDQSSLTDSAKAILIAFVHEFRKSRNRMDLRIIGHTDSDGDNAYNKQLSVNRAQTVRLFLISKGVKNRISLYSKGENQLLRNGQTKAAHQTNRRVEINVQQRTKQKHNLYGTAAGQVHEVNTNKATELIGVKGTRIRFPKNSFKLPHGDSLVEVTFREYTTKEDALFANLSTITPNGQLIESKGMVHIKARVNGKPVRLKRGKQIEILFEKRKEGDSTQVFYGQRFENGVTWTAGNKPTKCQTKIIYQDILIGGDIVSGYSETCGQVNGTKLITTFLIDGTLIERSMKLGEEYADMSDPMRSSRLGWINCDRFYKSAQEKIDFVIKSKNDSNLRVFLVFNDINSIMPYSYQQNNEYYFKNVPIGMKVTVVALHKADEKEDCHIARVSTNISRRFNKTLSFKKVKKSDVHFN